MNELTLLDGAARGMAAERTILDVAARNVAAAQASTPGHAYRRLVATLATQPTADGEVPDAFADPLDDDESSGDGVTVRTEPGTGDALTELIAVLDAQRAFEADASVFDSGKRLAERTLDIER